jgi:hypothetical protein
MKSEDLSIFFNTDEFAEKVKWTHSGVEKEINAIINYAVDIGKFSGVRGSGAVGSATISKEEAILFVESSNKLPFGKLLWPL